MIYCICIYMYVCMYVPMKRNATKNTAAPTELLNTGASPIGLSGLS